jgi:hypothetical protein
LAENSRTFTSIFDLVDNFTNKFDAIQKKANSISDRAFGVRVDFNQSKAGQALDNIQKKVNDTTSTTNSWNNALGRAAGIADKTSSATQKIGSEAQKSTGFIGSMQGKLENVGGVADRLRDKFGAITSLLAGGSIGGMSWLNAMASEKADKSFDRRLARMHIDTKPIDDFVAKAEGTGYTTTSTRQDIAESLLIRTKLRGSKMESTTKAIEDLYAQNSYDLGKKGITSAEDLADLLTKKKLGPGDKQTLIDLGIKGTGVSSRLRSAEKQAKGIDESALAKEDPYQTFLNRMSETSKKVGKTMVEPMNMVLEKVNSLLDLINNIPGAPGLIAMVAVMMAAAGGASLLLTVLSPLAPLLTFLKGAIIGQAVANQVLATSEVEVGVASGIMGAGIWTALAPIILIGAPLLALGAALYMVEQKTHVFSKAFKSLGKTEMAHDLLDSFKDVGYWIRESIKWLDSLYKMLKTTGLSKVVLGAAFGPIGLALGAASMLSGKDPGELLSYLVDQGKGVLRWASTTFPFFARIHEILKKVQSLFEWLYALFQSFWSWIQKAIPGAQKESKRTEIEKLAEKSGMTFDSSSGKFKWLNQMEHGGAVDVPTEQLSQKLRDKRDEWSKLPGVADGIAQAVAKGLSGIGTTIADAIKGLVMDIPGMEGVSKALISLQTTIDNLQTWLDAHNLGGVTSGISSAATSTIGATVLGPAYYPAEATYNYVTGHAAGATFTRGGLFAGKVHSPEEIIPQAIASRGPGPISRALDVLDSVMSGQPSSMGTGAGEIHVHMPTQDFSGMKISSNVDLERILREANKKAVADAVSEVKKLIGQRRT